MVTLTDHKVKHPDLDDIQGLGIGMFLYGLGLHVMTHLGLITGQTAGVAVIIGL